MLDAKYKGLLDSTKNVNSSATLYIGRPVSLNSSAEVVACDGTTNYPVSGLSMGDKNIYRDDSYGEFAAFGSGKMGFLSKGIAIVGPTTYSTGSGSVTVQVYDTTKTYAVNEKLYCNTSGLITNDSSVIVADGLTETLNYVGTVRFPPSGSNTDLEINLDAKF
jgi:hypothetical protein